MLDAPLRRRLNITRERRALEIEDIDTDSPSSSKKKGMFDWTVNLGHVFIVISFLVSGAGVYAAQSARLAVIETKVDAITMQNLPPRVSALEANSQALHESLNGIRDVLVQIRNSLDTKADKK